MPATPSDEQIAQESIGAHIKAQDASTNPPAEPVVEVPAQFEKRSSGQSVAQGATTGVLLVAVDASPSAVVVAKFNVVEL